MVFSELYSAYYNAVAEIIARAVEGNLDDKTIYNIIEDRAFGESMLSIVPSLKTEKWQLVTHDNDTPIRHVPTMPLTLLQKRWLKSLSLDKRVKLFDIEFSGLENVQPLFTEKDYVVFDNYLDGDDYDDQEYIARFKTLLKAVKESLALKVDVENRKGEIRSLKFIPKKIEYSEKDDKFRVIANGKKGDIVINIARIKKCKIYNGEANVELTDISPQPKSVTFMVTDERNSLDRCVLHFAHFEKRVEKVGDKDYKVSINYDKDDEMEIVIRILSFGPYVKVIEPLDIIELVKEKLKNQQKSGLKL